MAKQACDQADPKPLTNYKPNNLQNQGQTDKDASRNKYNREKTYISKLGYNKLIKIASLNVRNAKPVETQEMLIQYMKDKEIDILAMQETYVNTNSKLNKDKQ